MSNRKYDEVELVERARIAYRKAGGQQQPEQGGQVVEKNGAVFVILRNINGILTVYELKGESLVGLDVWPEELDELEG